MGIPCCENKKVVRARREQSTLYRIHLDLIGLDDRIGQQLLAQLVHLLSGSFGVRGL
jgi:hypothetical protein